MYKAFSIRHPSIILYITSHSLISMKSPPYSSSIPWVTFFNTTEFQWKLFLIITWQPWNNLLVMRSAELPLYTHRQDQTSLWNQDISYCRLSEQCSVMCSTDGSTFHDRGITLPTYEVHLSRLPAAFLTWIYTYNIEYIYT